MYGPVGWGGLCCLPGISGSGFPIVLRAVLVLIARRRDASESVGGNVAASIGGRNVPVRLAVIIARAMIRVRLLQVAAHIVVFRALGRSLT